MYRNPSLFPVVFNYSYQEEGILIKLLFKHKQLTIMLKTILTGNLGSDAKVREYNGKQALSFSVAHNEKYKDANAVIHEKTMWINCTLWRDKETSLAKYLLKGQLVFLEGIPSVGIYKNRDGESVADFSLKVTNLELLGNKPNTKNQKDDTPWEQ